MPLAKMHALKMLTRLPLPNCCAVLYSWRMPYPTTGRPKGRPPKLEKVAPPTSNHADTSKPPEFLECYRSSQEAWAYIWANCPWLDAAKGDGLLVGLISLKITEVVNLRARLNQNGASYLAANGQYAAKPEVRQLEAAEAQLTAWLASLGLSPADRARLNLNAATTGDTLAEYRARNARRALEEVKSVVHNLA